MTLLQMTPQATLPILITTVVATNGSTVSGNTAGRNETLYIDPSGPLLDLTFQLPPSNSARLGQISRAFISQVITNMSITVAGGGTTEGLIADTSMPGAILSYQCVGLDNGGLWVSI